jgi:hypothetical protein
VAGSSERDIEPSSSLLPKKFGYTLMHVRKQCAWREGGGEAEVWPGTPPRAASRNSIAAGVSSHAENIDSYFASLYAL